MMRTRTTRRHVLCLSVTIAAGAVAAQDDCLSKGTQLFAENNYKQAVMALRKCDGKPEAQKLLGLAYFELNYMEDAKTYLSTAIAANPDNVSLKIKYADAFAHNREFRKGVKEFKKLAEAYPGNEEVKKGLARVLGWNRDYDEAIVIYRELLKKDPKDFESWIQIATLTSWDKRFREAVKEYKAILAAKPPEEQEIEARIRFGEVLSWMKKFDQAITEYDKAIALDPQAGKAYLGKGQVLEWQGKYKKAIEVYEKALQADPGNKDAKGRLQQLMWVK